MADILFMAKPLKVLPLASAKGSEVMAGQARKFRGFNIYPVSANLTDSDIAKYTAMLVANGKQITLNNILDLKLKDQDKMAVPTKLSFKNDKPLGIAKKSGRIVRRFMRKNANGEYRIINIVKSDTGNIETKQGNKPKELDRSVPINWKRNPIDLNKLPKNYR